MSNPNSKISSTVNSPIIGIILMIVNSITLALIDIMAKVLRADMSSGTIVFCYKFTLFIMILPWVLRHGLKYLKTKRIHVHILRSFTGTLGALFFFQGLKYVTAADAAALENVQYLFIFCLGFILFKEKITKTKIAAIILGLLGAIVVVYPEILSFDGAGGNIKPISSYIYTIIAISIWSLNSIIIKILGNTEDNRTQMFYVLLFACIISFPTAFFKWNLVDFAGFNLPLSPSSLDFSTLQLSWWHFALLFTMAIVYFVHASAYFHSLRSELSIVVPYRYTKLAFSALLGYMFFMETINFNSLVGYILIIVSGFMLLRYQMRKTKKSRQTNTAAI
mgnify:CR=1 FL=1